MVACGGGYSDLVHHHMQMQAPIRRSYQQRSLRHALVKQTHFVQMSGSPSEPATAEVQLAAATQSNGYNHQQYLPLSFIDAGTVDYHVPDLIILHLLQ